MNTATRKRTRRAVAQPEVYLKKPRAQSAEVKRMERLRLIEDNRCKSCNAPLGLCKCGK